MQLRILGLALSIVALSIAPCRGDAVWSFPHDEFSGDGFPDVASAIGSHIHEALSHLFPHVGNKPKFDKPKFDKPKFDKPKFDKPKFDKPKFDKPKFDFPKFEFPKFEFPKFDLSKIDFPKFEFPKFDFPKFDKPKYDKPKYDKPKYDKPDYGQDVNGGESPVSEAIDQIEELIEQVQSHHNNSDDEMFDSILANITQAVEETAPTHPEFVGDVIASLTQQSVTLPNEVASSNVVNNPEPGSVVLAAFALLSLLGFSRRLRRRVVG